VFRSVDPTRIPLRINEFAVIAELGPVAAAALQPVCVFAERYTLTPAGGFAVIWPMMNNGSLATLPPETTPTQRIQLLAQAATALATLHSFGVAHRQVSPSRFLVHMEPEGTPRVRIGDFRLACRSDRAFEVAEGPDRPVRLRFSRLIVVCA